LFFNSIFFKELLQTFALKMMEMKRCVWSKSCVLL